MALRGSSFCFKVNFIDSKPPNSLNKLSVLPSSSKAYSLFSLRHLRRRCSPLTVPTRATSSAFTKTSRLMSLKACQVASEDSRDLITSDNIVLDEQTLNRDLQVAIEEENYAQAAKIRDSLKSLQEDSKASVQSANARFYSAFRNGDLSSMQKLWAKGENVCCVHPGASGVTGYDDVMESWELVWMNYDFPLEIELKNIRVHFRGDVGYVNCVEFIRTKGSSWGAQFVTNVFERIDGQWFICIHHASPVDLDA
ncbi:Nuclear transport factor 2 (NTF2) family protein [Euphorbia peplus]|nr:Nuclear transport factor 2 (NTF2) family protein [Euphorbia peplus]